MSNLIKRILSPLASLRLTVLLMALAIVLILAGTTAQRETGIWDVQKKYFHSVFTWIDFQVFLPLPEAGHARFPGGFPMLGGYALGALLLTNLLAAHAVRFKFNRKRIGVLLTHFGLVLLLLGEFFTSVFAVESQMYIPPGGSANYSQDIRGVELAVVDTSPAAHDEVTVIPGSRLHKNANVRQPRLPFDVHVDEYYANSRPVGPFENVPGSNSLATQGANVGKRITEVPRLSGVEEGGTDLASAYVTLSAAGKSLGTYLVAQFYDPQPVVVDGKSYQIDLRFKRYYKPYTLELLKFSHDRYTGTDVAKNFASRVRLVDPAHNEDREALIWMNHPLRYAGETFYQQSFTRDKVGNDTGGTILQVVANPSWLMPYAACTIGALGMLIHFGTNLIVFLRKQESVPLFLLFLSPGYYFGWRAARSIAAGSERNAKQPSKSRKRVPASGPSSGEEYVLLPQRRWTSPRFMVPAGIVAVCVIYLASLLQPRNYGVRFDIDGFGRVPVSYEGRIQPLDSLARNILKAMSGRDTVKTENGRVPAIQWLLDVFGQAERGLDYKVFRVDHPDVLSHLELDASQKLFSVNDLKPHIDKLVAQAQMAKSVQPKQRDLYQIKVLELADKLEMYVGLRQMAGLYLVPPSSANQEWQRLGEAMQGAQAGTPSEPVAKSFVGLIDDFQQNSPSDFNRDLASYHSLVRTRIPSAAEKAGFESFFNQIDPFMQCMAFYVLVFVLTCLSWLGARSVLLRSAFWVLMLTLMVHTLGLIGRIYISGRPPVTNLASSAIFIAWGAVLLSSILERLFRNGVGNVTAAVMGFASLLISDRLSLDGDNMKVLVAVLDTNFWLATHVVVITLGYASTFLAGFLAIIYVIQGVFTKSLTRDEAKNLSRMIYGIVCFATLFSFVGTILGGIWADQSWGRFWGWDPKENGAVLIVLWNALLLHARWCGLARERGVALLALGGNIVTSWSWFGTNMLGVGLHSYGFMEAAFPWLIGFVISQLILIGIGNIPLGSWRSFAIGAATAPARKAAGSTGGVGGRPASATR